MSKVPKGALRFVSQGATVCTFADGDDKKPKMNMTVYSGKTIEGHWYWGRLAIDLQGGKYPLSKYPVLENHDTGRKIAFSGKPVVTDKIALNPDTTKFVDTEVSKEFQKLSSEGFPYQASIYAVPSSVEWVKEGESVEVNGFKMRGPGAVWRNWEYQEASVCVFGWDSKTASSAFSREETQDVEFEEIGEHVTGALNHKKEPDEKEVNEEMDITVEMLKKDFPEIVQALQDEVESKFTSKFTALSDDMAILAQSVKDLSAENKTLQKESAINREKSLKADADAIFTNKLSDSSIREELYPKVRMQLSYSTFVDDKGKFDAEKFMEAVEKEVGDWEELIGEQNVLGGGSTERSAESTKTKEVAKLKAENEATTNTLLSLAGQKTE